MGQYQEKLKGLCPAARASSTVRTYGLRLSKVEENGLYPIMDYLRMDGKRGHVTCGNRSAIERQESFQKFASLEEELLLPSAQACWDPTRFRMA